MTSKGLREARIARYAAKAILDRPYADPDDDAAVVARAYLAALSQPFVPADRSPDLRAAAEDVVLQESRRVTDHTGMLAMRGVLSIIPTKAIDRLRAALSQPSVPAEQNRGWIVEQGSLGNVHVIPAEQQNTISEHEASVGCWCDPRRADPDEPDLMGRDVYLHRRTHDHDHRYTDDER